MNLPAYLRDSSAPPRSLTDFEILASVRSVLRQERDQLQSFYEKVPVEMAEAARIIHDCQGAVIVSGIGKAGWVGQKLSASFASTGTRSHFVHAAEAFHGDLGRVAEDDVILVLSNSGETEEVVKILPPLQRQGNRLIALTGSRCSTLARRADCVIDYGRVREACPNNLAPSTSTTLMLAIGDALALTVSSMKGFTALDFGRYHPGGSLGRKLQMVDEAMRPLSHCRVTVPQATVRESIARQARQGRRSGALLILSPENRLLGIFTDSDLVRILERKQDGALDQPIAELMTADPIRIRAGSLVSEAVDLLSSRCISELPVVDDEDRVVGMIDITDVIA